MAAVVPLRLALAASLLIGSTAEAQPFRAYLSPSGSDANPCTLQAPCRLLPAALAAVANGGEIWMTGSANYNTAPVFIDKSVSILAVPGVVGSLVAVNGGPAVAITANGLEVALRNVVIGPVAGQTPGTFGAAVTGDSVLIIENSLIAGVPSHGVWVDGAGELKMSNTTVRNNGGWAVDLRRGARADISNSQMVENGDGGVLAVGNDPTGTTASVSDSFISGGVSAGVRAFSESGGVARIALTRSTISRIGGWALDCFGSGSSTIYVGSNLIAYNGSAWDASCGSLFTAGNNQFNRNGAGIGSLTPLALQ